jgi:hypothetical protein
MIYTEKRRPAGTEAAQVLTYQRSANVSANTGEAQHKKRLRPQSKRASLLRAFLKLGDDGMNCFEAANQHHDYVLRSSISDFRRNLGIEFHRIYETVQGHNGSKIDCCRYWLTSAGVDTARELLGDSREAA